jgi:hypothetical protein
MAHQHENDDFMDIIGDDMRAYPTDEGGGFSMFTDTTAPPSDSEFAERHRQAQESYSLKLFMVKEKVMHKPNLDTLYYNQAAALMTNIPADLQLPVLLSEYNNVSLVQTISLDRV